MHIQIIRYLISYILLVCGLYASLVYAQDGLEWEYKLKDGKLPSEFLHVEPNYIIFQTSTSVTCLNKTSGEFVWSYISKMPSSVAPIFFKSTNQILLFDHANYLTSLDASTGNKNWTTKLGANVHIKNSISICNELIVVLLGDSGLNPESSRSLIEIYDKSGRFLQTHYLHIRSDIKPTTKDNKLYFISSEQKKIEVLTLQSLLTKNILNTNLTDSSSIIYASDENNRSYISLLISNSSLFYLTAFGELYTVSDSGVLGELLMKIPGEFTGQAACWDGGAIIIGKGGLIYALDLKQMYYQFIGSVNYRGNINAYFDSQRVACITDSAAVVINLQNKSFQFFPLEVKAHYASPLLFKDNKIFYMDTQNIYCKKLYYWDGTSSTYAMEEVTGTTSNS